VTHHNRRFNQVFVLGNFVIALSKVLDMVLSLYTWLIIIRALASWFAPDPYNPLFQFLVRVTEPVLGYIRRVIPFRMGMMDLSPIIALLAIIFLQNFLVVTLHRFGVSLQ
jgi:YggT family protein